MRAAADGCGAIHDAGGIEVAADGEELAGHLADALGLLIYIRFWWDLTYLNIGIWLENRFRMSLGCRGKALDGLGPDIELGMTSEFMRTWRYLSRGGWRSFF